MATKAWSVLLLLAGCQAQLDGTEPVSPTMPPAKDDAAVGDPEGPGCEAAGCVQAPGDPDRGDATVDGVEREPNDDPAAATPLGVPVAVVAGELGSGDHDWFAVRIVQRGGYVFETSTGDLGDDQATDTLVHVYGDGGTGDPIASDDDSGEGLGSRAAVNLSPGQILVEVTGYGGAVAGPYTLEVRGPQEIDELEQPAEPEPGDDVVEPPLLAVAETDESEQNDTVGDADSMGEAPESIGAELEPAGVDHFAFVAAAAGTVTIETGPRQDGGSTVDTVLELYTADGLTLLGTDDDGADAPLFSRLTVDLPSAGVYVIRVRGYSDASLGSYRAYFVH